MNKWTTWMNLSKATLIAIFATPIFFYLYIQTESTIYSTTSPNGEYSVSITRDRHPILLPERRIYLYAENEDKSLIYRKQILSADWLEGSFKAYYPNHSWLDSNVLTMGQKEEKLKGILRVTNEGKTTISYLLIENEDNKFMIFDLKPNSTKKLNFNSFNYLSVEWEIVGNPNIFGDGINVKDNDDYLKNLHFDLKLNEQNIEFEVPGYKIETGVCCGIQRRDY